MTADSFNLSDLAMDAPPVPRPSRRRPPSKVSGRFLRGPIPWAWLVTAARLPGRALHVGIVLWHVAWRTGDMKVSLSLTRTANELGCNRSSASRALAALEKAGLVTAKRMNGRNVEVDILEIAGAGVAAAAP